MADHIGDRPNRYVRHRRINRHPTAIRMGHCHHPVHIGIFRKKLSFHPLHRHLKHPRSTLDRCHNPQKIPCPSRPLRIFVPHPGRAGRHRQLLHRYQICAILHILHRRTLRQLQHMLIDPISLFNRLNRIPQNHTIPNDLTARRNILQSHLMGLRNILICHQALHNLRSLSRILHNHYYIVLILNLDILAFLHPFPPLSFYKIKSTFIQLSLLYLRSCQK